MTGYITQTHTGTHADKLKSKNNLKTKNVRGKISDISFDQIKKSDPFKCCFEALLVGLIAHHGGSDPPKPSCISRTCRETLRPGCLLDINVQLKEEKIQHKAAAAVDIKM